MGFGRSDRKTEHGSGSGWPFQKTRVSIFAPTFRQASERNYAALRVDLGFLRGNDAAPRNMRFPPPERRLSEVPTRPRVTQPHEMRTR
jgi:hypothetical protein